MCRQRRGSSKAGISRLKPRIIDITLVLASNVDAEIRLKYTVNGSSRLGDRPDFLSGRKV